GSGRRARGERPWRPNRCRPGGAPSGHRPRRAPSSRCGRPSHRRPVVAFPARERRPVRSLHVCLHGVTRPVLRAGAYRRPGQVEADQEVGEGVGRCRHAPGQVGDDVVATGKDRGQLAPDFRRSPVDRGLEPREEFARHAPCGFIATAVRLDRGDAQLGGEHLEGEVALQIGDATLEALGAQVLPSEPCSKCDSDSERDEQPLLPSIHSRPPVAAIAWTMRSIARRTVLPDTPEAFVMTLKIRSRPSADRTYPPSVLTWVMVPVLAWTRPSSPWSRSSSVRSGSPGSGSASRYSMPQGWRRTWSRSCTIACGVSRFWADNPDPSTR